MKRDYIVERQGRSFVMYAGLLALASGQRLAPVIDVDGKILADFGPDELAKFWEKISTTDGHG